MIKCIIIEDELPAQKVLKTYIENTPFLSLIKCMHSGIEAIDLLHKEEVHLIFLDIHLPQLSGLNFLRTLKNPPQVIITSAYPQYALEGYELDVMDYLLKPFSFERFIKAVNKYPGKNPAPSLEPNHLSEPAQAIFIKSDGSLVKILLDEIIYLKSDKDFVRIFTTQNKYLELQTLSHYERSLPHQFMRVHKSYLVNLEKLESVKGNIIQIKDNQIPIGRTYRDGLLKRLGLKY